jgi:hypothetical protein
LTEIPLVWSLPDGSLKALTKVASPAIRVPEITYLRRTIWGNKSVIAGLFRGNTFGPLPTDPDAVGSNAPIQVQCVKCRAVYELSLSVLGMLQNGLSGYRR